MKILLLGLSLFLVSCGHHRDVRPGASGVHKVVVRAEEKETGERDAIEQAKHYCKQSKRSAFFIEENSKYDGDLDESTYKKARVITKVAQAAGSGAFVMGGRRESTAGGIGVIGGSAGQAALGKGYLVQMAFKCQ
jgi:hypothetical protein